MNQSNHKRTYPLMDHAADSLQAASGRALADITLDAAEAGELSAADLRIKPETLQTQAEIAAGAGFPQLATNLSRAAELTAVPNEELLQMYEKLRPNRCTYEELTALADTLENNYNALENARLVREAAAAYQARGLLRKDRD